MSWSDAKRNPAGLESGHVRQSEQMLHPDALAIAVHPLRDGCPGYAEPRRDRCGTQSSGSAGITYTLGKGGHVQILKDERKRLLAMR